MFSYFWSFFFHFFVFFFQYITNNFTQCSCCCSCFPSNRRNSCSSSPISCSINNAIIIALLFFIFPIHSRLSVFNLQCLSIMCVNSVTRLFCLLRCSALFVSFLILRREHRSVTYVNC